MDKLSEYHSFELHSDPIVRDKIRNLFYLRLYLGSDYQQVKIVDLDGFYGLIWRDKIVGYKDKDPKEATIFEMVKRRIKNLEFYVKCEDLLERALDGLKKNGVIQYYKNKKRYFITQDIFYQLALRKFIDQLYKKHKSFTEFKEQFVNEFGKTATAKEVFSSWAENKLRSSKDDDFKHFIQKALIEDNKDWYYYILKAIA